MKKRYEREPDLSWSAAAPANIALIKYMGKAERDDIISSHKTKQSLTGRLSKKDKEGLFCKNISLNPSLSYALKHFITKVQIKESKQDNWSPFHKDPFGDEKLYTSSKKIDFDNQISKEAQEKFLVFFQYLKRFFLIPGNYTIFSQNNFPTGTGAASSASSFAALTLAAYELAKTRSPLKDKIKNLQIKDLAQLSRIGSGSSCRSFFSPWCIWSGKDISLFQAPWQLLHQLIIVENQTKPVSSREAHQRVKTSPHFKDRVKRANKRLKLLISALQTRDWKKCFKICYEEFMDMHSLFETASPAFKYKTAKSQKVLNHINAYWKKNNEGPLVTMDAGANVHLLYHPDQHKHRKKITDLLSDYVILSSLEV